MCWLGVVLDVSLDGEKVMRPAYMDPGDQFAISLCLPDQTMTMNVDAALRWGNRHTFRLECTAVSQLADTRTRNFLSRASSPREQANSLMMFFAGLFLMKEEGMVDQSCAKAVGRTDRSIFADMAAVVR